jgi:hypothetical protein
MNELLVIDNCSDCNDCEDGQCESGCGVGCC